MALYTNSTGRDTVRNAFMRLSSAPCDVLIASPFFTFDSQVRELVDRGCRVSLIVRLGPATSARALGRVLAMESTKVRFFTSERFHSKLYIFGERAALVGSANMTDAGFSSNREICVELDSDDERFEDLVALYQSYWDAAQVLNESRLAEYDKVCKSVSGASRDFELERKVKAALGKDEVLPEGIQSIKKKRSRDRVYAESYRKRYQEFLGLYGQLESMYLDAGQRKVPEERVPLRLEVDQFLNYLRIEECPGAEYQDAPLRQGDDLASNVAELLVRWFRTDWPPLDTGIAVAYQRLSSQFGSAAAITTASEDEVFEALCGCHAFKTRKRFFKGGLLGLKTGFFDSNELDRVKDTIRFLLHGKGDYIDRMADCLYSPDYKLQQFGRSCVQELYGWVNQDEIPICNGRTMKMMRYLGFDMSRVK